MASTLFFFVVCAFLALFLATVWQVIRHARIELKGENGGPTLSEYLGDLIGFRPPRFLGPAFFFLATGILLAPLGLMLVNPALLLFSVWWIVGGLVADTFGTHLVPTWISGKRSPATGTAPVYLILAFLWASLGTCGVLTTGDLLAAVAGTVIGTLLFLGLWPLLLGFRAAGILPPRS